MYEHHDTNGGIFICYCKYVKLTVFVGMFVEPQKMFANMLIRESIKILPLYYKQDAVHNLFNKAT